MDGFVPAAPVPSNEGKGLTGNITAKTPLLTSGGWHDRSGLSLWFFWNGSHKPSSVRVYPDQKYRLPLALEHALYRLEEVQGEINDPELSPETRQKARKNRDVLNGWITYYKEQLGI